MKKIIIASTSTIHGSGYLEYILPTLANFYDNSVEEVVFIPYARPSGISYEAYTAKAEEAFNVLDIQLKGIHEFEDPKKAIENAQGLFVGGGNTFELVHQLYKHDILQTLKNVIEKGTPYLGTSAGSNICGISMKNTNDMPIVYPPSFDTMALIPFNINAHYLDPNPDSTHMGETRETRIKEFHIYNETPVLGIREGGWLEVNGDKIILKGKPSARLFRRNKPALEIDKETIIDLNMLR